MAERKPEQKLTIGVDIGGTKIAAGLVTAKGRLVHSVVVPTLADRDLETSLGQVYHVINLLMGKAGGMRRIEGIGICAPGPLNPKTGVVLTPPNLPAWRHVPLAALVRNRFQLPAAVENDANAAGLAEVLIGAAAAYRDAFYVTVSTGIGTGIIIDRQIYHGKNGVAGEGGHVLVDYRSPFVCGCGMRGCIEALASGPGMARRARVLLEHDPATPSLLRNLDRRNGGGITPKAIADAARRHDPIATTILEETAFYLSVWLGSMVSLLDPEAIVIGGGVAQIGDPLFDIIRKTMPQFTIHRDAAGTLPIVPAKLKTNVGIFGAASLFWGKEPAARTQKT